MVYCNSEFLNLFSDIIHPLYQIFQWEIKLKKKMLINLKKSFYKKNVLKELFIYLILTLSL